LEKIRHNYTEESAAPHIISLRPAYSGFEKTLTDPFESPGERSYNEEQALPQSHPLKGEPLSAEQATEKKKDACREPAELYAASQPKTLRVAEIADRWCDHLYRGG
jgi:hypothetical protein